jgi:hypothetical protein
VRNPRMRRRTHGNERERSLKKKDLILMKNGRMTGGKKSFVDHQGGSKKFAIIHTMNTNHELTLLGNTRTEDHPQRILGTEMNPEDNKDLLQGTKSTEKSEQEVDLMSNQLTEQGEHHKASEVEEEEVLEDSLMDHPLEKVMTSTGHQEEAVATSTGHQEEAVATSTGHQGEVAETLTGHQGEAVATLTGHQGEVVETSTDHQGEGVETSTDHQEEAVVIKEEEVVNTMRDQATFPHRAEVAHGTEVKTLTTSTVVPTTRSKKKDLSDKDSKCLITVTVVTVATVPKELPKA